MKGNNKMYKKAIAIFTVFALTLGSFFAFSVDNKADAQVFRQRGVVSQLVNGDLGRAVRDIFVLRQLRGDDAASRILQFQFLQDRARQEALRDQLRFQRQLELQRLRDAQLRQQLKNQQLRTRQVLVRDRFGRQFVKTVDQFGRTLQLRRVR